MPSTNALASVPTLRAFLSNLDVEGAALQKRCNRGYQYWCCGDTGEGDSHTGTSRKSTIIGAPSTVVSGLDMDLNER
jgi:hypothetical protein